MNVVSKIVDLDIDSPLTTEVIENKLNEMGIEPLRWAIVKVNGTRVTISLACENL